MFEIMEPKSLCPERHDSKGLIFEITCILIDLGFPSLSLTMEPWLGGPGNFRNACFGGSRLSGYPVETGVDPCCKLVFSGPHLLDTCFLFSADMGS